ncbi:MAG: alpha-1,2-fucosyltransferase [Pirellulaceae bacterium]|nr:alpha-1,2-fucosyltransferase [Pirellulaceae bacterium]
MKVAVVCYRPSCEPCDWSGFYESAERYLLPDSQRSYYVVGKQPLDTGRCSVRASQVQSIELRANTASSGFEVLLDLENQLTDFDYVYCFTADCRFQRSVSAELLPQQPDQIVVVQHPQYVNIPCDRLPYERNAQSRAGMPIGAGHYYVTSLLFGGTTATVLGMAQTICEDLQADWRNGVAAIAAEESHLNRYITLHPYRLCHAGFCYPQGWDLGVPRVIEVADPPGGMAIRHLVSDSSEKSSGRPVTVEISGDLGSQLFQYAAGRVAAERNGCDLQLDTRYFDCLGEHRYGLGHFNIHAQIATTHTLPRRGKWHVRGTWHSERYFADVAAVLRQELTWAQPATGRCEKLLKQITSQPSVAIQVDAGLPVRYYDRAIDYIRRTTGSYLRAVVFCNDLRWAQQNIVAGAGTVYVQSNARWAAHDDLRLMAACDHQVVARSSLGWWSAWLNINPHKRIVVPSEVAAAPGQEQDDWITAGWHCLDISQPATILARAA